MTIERQYGQIIFLCDVGSSPQCDEQIETGLSDFDAAFAEAKRQGWNAAPVGADWHHYCHWCPRPKNSSDPR